MAKSDWTVVKDPKAAKPVKPTNGDAKVSKKPAVAKVEAVKSNGVTKAKETKKKVTPRKPIFELNETAVGRMGGSGTGTTAAINAMNLLTAEFTAPERIPPYDKDNVNFPSSKLQPAAKEKLVQIIKSMKEETQRTQFVRVLVNNLISSSRRAEGAWGCRAMGQMLMQTCPELGVLKEDILGTETHPGSVLSVVWLYCQARTTQALMSVLFWLVFPRLKQKKVAEYLPKLLDDIQTTLKKGQPIDISPSQVSSIILALSDSKLTKPTQKKITDFYTFLGGYLTPTSTWIPSFIPHLVGSRQIHALPIIIQAIENETAKSTQVLKELATENRLQVQYILDAVPESVLGAKYRNIIVASVEKPMASSVEIRRTKPDDAKAVKKTSPPSSGGSMFGCAYVSGIVKYMIYLFLLVGVSSKLEATRPYYQTYAEPYYNLYMKDTVDSVIVPNYEQYVEPQINNYVLPSYNVYVKPRVAQGAELVKKHITPKVVQYSAQAVEAYKLHLEPKITSAIKSARPAMTQVVTEVEKLMGTMRSKASTFTDGWGDCVDSSMTTMRLKMDVAAKMTRSTLDGTIASAQKWYKGTNVQQLFWTYLDVVKGHSVNGLELMKGHSLTGFELVKAKTMETYDTLLTASAGQREVVNEKLAVGIAFAGVKAGEINALLVKYEIDSVLGSGFEAIGRSVIWTGDLLGELSQMRWCCAKDRMIGLKNLALEASKNLYEKVQNMSK